MMRKIVQGMMGEIVWEMTRKIVQGMMRRVV
jgi:hypothetical protein